MKIRLVSTSDAFGGAARAAFRLHSALQRADLHDVQSVLQVARKYTDLIGVQGPSSKLAKGWPLIKTATGACLQSLQFTDNSIFHSSAWLPCTLDRVLNRCQDDLVHLHWVQEEMLSIEAIGRLRKPLVWTLHDSWAFCGSEHCPNGLYDRRYQQGYSRSNRPPSHRGFDLDRWCWHRKVRQWRRPINIVCPSTWLADCVRRSALMASWPVTVIPNALPTQIYQPWPRLLARKMFGLPTDIPLVLFGAIKGMHDQNKGWSLLEPALRLLAEEIPGVQAVVFGQSAPAAPLQLGLPVNFVGRVYDDQSLAMLYSAADVMVVPSRMENLPQTASEAQSCGIPVIAFSATGLMDVVEHKVTGYLAQPYSSRDLANGIVWTLSDSDRYDLLSSQARQRAVNFWSEDVVMKQYLSLYQGVLDQRCSNRVA